MTNNHFSETFLAVLPLYHIYGLFTFILHAARHHSRVIIFPAFVPLLLMKAVEHYHIHLLHAVPPMVLFLAQTPLIHKFDLSSLKFVICGGERVFQFSIPVLQ